MAQQDLRFSDEKYTERLLGAISHHDGYIIYKFPITSSISNML